MMRTAWIVALLVAAAGLWGGTTEAQQRKASPFAKDARLNKAVSVHWKKAALNDALREVSQATGVRLVCDRGLVDEPVMAAAKEIPARQLLEQLATLLHYTWLRSGGTPEAPSYLLIQDRAQKQEEQDEIDRGERLVLEALSKELERYRRLSKLPPEQLQKEQEKADQELTSALAGGISSLVSLGSNPAGAKRIQEGQAVRAVGTPIGRAMLDLLEGLKPEQWRQLREEEVLVFSTHPGDGEQPLPAVLRDQLKAAKPQIPFPKAFLSAIAPQAEQGLGQVEQMMQDQWSQASDYRVTVSLSLTLGGAPVGMLRAAPEPVGAQAIGPVFALSGLMVTGSPRLAEEPQEDPAEREKRLAADPLLGKKAVLKLAPPPKREGLLALLGNAYLVSEVLPALEEAFGVQLLADGYTRQALSVIPAPGMAEMPLYKVLDQLAGMGRQWERDGDLIRLKSRTWAQDRRGEIPQRLMQRWEALRKQQGGLTLDNLAEIAGALRDTQVETLMYAAMELGSDSFLDYTTASGSAGILRLYNKLNLVQRRTLQAGRPLPVRGMLPQQQALLVGLNRAQNRSFFSFATGAKPHRRPDQLANAVLTLESVQLPPMPRRENPLPFPIPTASGPVYTFHLAFPDGQKDDFTVMTTAAQR
jgi:hypothetical protein